MILHNPEQPISIMRFFFSVNILSTPVQWWHFSCALFTWFLIHRMCEECGRPLSWISLRIVWLRKRYIRFFVWRPLEVFICSSFIARLPHHHHHHYLLLCARTPKWHTDDCTNKYIYIIVAVQNTACGWSLSMTAMCVWRMCECQVGSAYGSTYICVVTLFPVPFTVNYVRYTQLRVQQCMCNECKHIIVYLFVVHSGRHHIWVHLSFECTHLFITSEECCKSREWRFASWMLKCTPTSDLQHPESRA